MWNSFTIIWLKIIAANAVWILTPQTSFEEASVVRVNHSRQPYHSLRRFHGKGAWILIKIEPCLPSCSGIYSVCNTEASGLFFAKDFWEKTLGMGLIYIVGTRRCHDLLFAGFIPPRSKVFLLSWYISTFVSVRKSMRRYVTIHCRTDNVKSEDVFSSGHFRC